MRLGTRSALWALGMAATIVALVPAVAAPAAVVKHGATSPVQQRLLVAQGLSLGFAGQALQSQLRLILAATATKRACSAIDGGGSTRPGRPTTSAGSVHATDTLYFDARCTQPFEKQSAQFVDTGTGIDITATSSYFDTDGEATGTFTSSVTVRTPRGSRLTLTGIGTFQPAGAAAPAQYGLACSLPTGGSGRGSCDVGVEQDLADVSASVAAITPIELMLPGDGVSTPDAGRASRLSGPVGALWLAVSGRHLAVGGSGTSLGASTVSGTSVGLQLFPPTSAAWTVTDHPRQLRLRLVVGSGRRVAGTLTGGAGHRAELARISLDRTGTGTVTYAGEAATPVVEWTPAG